MLPAIRSWDLPFFISLNQSLFWQTPLIAISGHGDANDFHNAKSCLPMTYGKYKSFVLIFQNISLMPGRKVRILFRENHRTLD